MEFSKLSLPPLERKKGLPRRIPKGEKFIAGPIPLRWFLSAAVLPGKASVLGVLLYYLGGLEKNSTVRLSQKLCRAAGISRFSCYRALRLLERHNLVSVVRGQGRQALVTILLSDTLYSQSGQVNE